MESKKQITITIQAADSFEVVRKSNAEMATMDEDTIRTLRLWDLMGVSGGGYVGCGS